MYARTTTVEAQQPSAIDAGIAEIRETVMPALAECDGYVGLSLLVDRESGRCIATSAWQSEEDMRASMSRIEPVRDHVAQTLGGNPTVAEWEIALMHRDHMTGEGSCVRVTWAKLDPADVERGIDIFKMGAIPALHEIEGHCSESLLVDRSSGRGVSSVAYDSPEALARGNEQLGNLRDSVSTDARAEILEEHDFELAIAHLRVPEMA